MDLSARLFRQHNFVYRDAREHGTERFNSTKDDFTHGKFFTFDKNGDRKDVWWWLDFIPDIEISLHTHITLS